MTLSIVAQTGNLRCTWPREQHIVSHPATFAAAPAPAPEPLSPARLAALQRFAHVSAPALPARALPKDSPLVSRNGLRLPLRAFTWRELNRRFWSKGEVVFADKLERSKARELTLYERTSDPSSMTWEEIRDTADLEPLSESRRSWLERGFGVLSLEGLTYGEGSIGEMLNAKGQLGALGTLERNSQNDGFADEASSFGKGVAYETVDPITAKQIAWEQEQHSNSAVTRVKIVPKAGAPGLGLVTDRTLMPDEMMRLARSVKRTLLDESSHFDDLAGRFRLMPSAADLLGFSSADAAEERARYLEPADLEWHSSFEEPRPSIGYYAPFTKGTYTADFCPRNAGKRQRCFVTENHRHERVTRVVHRTPRRNETELWHQRIFDITAFELGTDGLVDALVSV
jgi:hypothetical protein